MKRYLWIVLLPIMWVHAGAANAFQNDENVEYSDHAKELVVEYMRLFQMDKIMDQMTSTARTQTIQQLASNSTLTDAQKQIAGDVVVEVLKDMEPEIIALSMRLTLENFSEEELEAIITFYSTETGQKIITKMPQMMQQLMVDMQGLMMGMQGRIQKLMQERFAEEADPDKGT